MKKNISSITEKELDYEKMMERKNLIYLRI